MLLALYLVIVLLVALFFALTWVAAMWGVSPRALIPLYLAGLLIAAGLIFLARRIRKAPRD